ncbi:hypothetical protein M9H77_33638 [Catharanthus roseus]|uniref:Uncharacterized protein n=1 Tax=Catharanthus roseus TaxID=4058 RepID=A0ACB9ZKQ2_CATRO|nr:hypothetical protein M9H77_33638 [Catharanthus roseus]
MESSSTGENTSNVAEMVRQGAPGNQVVSNHITRASSSEQFLSQPNAFQMQQQQLPSFNEDGMMEVLALTRLHAGPCLSSSKHYYSEIFLLSKTFALSPSVSQIQLVHNDN